MQSPSMAIRHAGSWGVKVWVLRFFHPRSEARSLCSSEASRPECVLLVYIPLLLYAVLFRKFSRRLRAFVSNYFEQQIRQYAP